MKNDGGMYQNSDGEMGGSQPPSWLPKIPAYGLHALYKPLPQ